MKVEFYDRYLCASMQPLHPPLVTGSNGSSAGAQATPHSGRSLGWSRRTDTRRRHEPRDPVANRFKPKREFHNGLGSVIGVLA